MKKPDISTDKIMAAGLVFMGAIYSIGSIFIGSPPSDALLGTLVGGLCGAIRGFAPQQKNQEEQKVENPGSDDGADIKMIK